MSINHVLNYRRTYRRQQQITAPFNGDGLNYARSQPDMIIHTPFCGATICHFSKDVNYPLAVVSVKVFGVVNHKRNTYLNFKAN